MVFFKCPICGKEFDHFVEDGDLDWTLLDIIKHISEHLKEIKKSQIKKKIKFEEVVE